MSISVAINGGGTRETSTVNVNVNESHVITDAEVAAWGLGDDALKNAVKASFGQRPDDAYLHSPTPWNDLYKTYSWPQVTTTLTVQSASVTSVDFQDTVVATRQFHNNSSVPATFTVGVTEQAAETAQTTWNNTQMVSVTQTIKYGISFLGTGGGGETAFHYEYAWAEGGSNSQTITLGTSTAATVTLQPGQSVEAELTAQRGTMTVDIVYLATLSGTTAINYGGTYKGHHFWGLDIGSVMAAAGIQNTRTFPTTVTVGYYSNASVLVRDIATGKELAQHSPLMLAGVS